jgi:hypothetical protein
VARTDILRRTLARQKASCIRVGQILVAQLGPRRRLTVRGFFSGRIDPLHKLAEQPLCFIARFLRGYADPCRPIVSLRSSPSFVRYITT